MGFREGSYATVWEVKPISDTITKARISTSRKNKRTNEYETDFSGFVGFIGTAAAKKAAGLAERDRIKLNGVDVTTSYNKETKVQYTNFNIFDFDKVESNLHKDTAAYSAYSGDNPVDGSDDAESSDLPF